ncbi:nuclease domain containing protein [Tubulinosema ratisbonensis]|uniref:Nuclease domain containing protein n=1 Tax=Tubulinosema ratisbonensis TaxID=291195 RepID=A0A437APX4_9MICR|nr:nuclease domain containing protein [Tubulinosema ratisbonensis]
MLSFLNNDIIKLLLFINLIITLVFLLTYLIYKLIHPYLLKLESLTDLLKHTKFPDRSVKIKGKVTKVIDGDTVKFSYKPLFGEYGKELTLRLMGIDAPEIAFRNKPGQPLGDISKKFVEEKCLNKIVKVNFVDIDRYNRIVANIFVKKESLSVLLVRNGLAFVYRGIGKFDNLKDKLVYEETLAKSKKIGIWKIKMEYPGEFRKENVAIV